MSKIKGCLKDDKGMALITVLLILVLLTTLGMYSVWTSNSETALGGNERLNKTAYYVAEAGLNEAMTRFSEISGMPYYISGTEKATLIANPDISWKYKGLVSVTNGFGSYSTYIYPTWTNTWNGSYHNYTGAGYGPPSLVLYNNKYSYPDSPVDGGPNGQIGFPVYHVISVGKIKDPGGRIISSARLSADITENSIDFQVPGGIYSGTDYNVTGSCQISAPPGDNAIVSGDGQDLSGIGHITSGNTANAYKNMSTFLGMNISQIKSIATETGCDLPPYLGSYPDDPQIMFVDNGCKYGCPGSPSQITFNGNVTGSGILVITGDIKIAGNIDFKGLVYILGSLTVTGSATVDGAIMVKGASTTTVTGNATVNLDRDVLEKVSRAGFSNKMIVWKDERQ
jgi:Tfp pilus assembly protein PilX